MATFLKDPSEKADYVNDWEDELAGDTISTSTWTLQTGVTQSTPSPSKTNTTATIWLTGGTDGTTYTVTNHVVTAGGREYERTIYIMVANR